jgi:hypothetical protein
MRRDPEQFPGKFDMFFDVSVRTQAIRPHPGLRAFNLKT